MGILSKLVQIGEANLDERKFPGITHLLRHNGDSHAVSVMMLETVVSMIRAGTINFPVSGRGPSQH